MAPITLKRDELYHEVWSSPLRTLAQKYGISDKMLKKICDKLVIPTPDPGYWNKVYAHHKQTKKKLPPQKQDHPDSYTIKKEIFEKIPLEPQAKELLEQEALQKEAIIVPTRLPKRIHPLLQSYMPILTSTNASDLMEKQECINIHVSPKNLNRAMRVADTMLRAFDKRGFIVTVTATKSSYGYSAITSKTTVTILGQKIEWKIKELNTIKKILVPQHRHSDGFEVPPYYQTDYVPTGKLSLHIESWSSDGLRKKWCDGKKQRIEDCIHDFIKGLIYVASCELSREKKWQAIEEQRQKEEALLLKRETIRKQKQAIRDDFKNRVATWQFVNDAKSFLAEYEALHKPSTEALHHNSALKQWLLAAYQYIQECEEQCFAPIHDEAQALEY